MQEVKQATQFSAMKLNLPDTQSVLVCIANIQQQPVSFTTYWDHLSLDDVVHEFRCVISQERKLVHVGDFVELRYAQYEEVHM